MRSIVLLSLLLACGEAPTEAPAPAPVPAAAPADPHAADPHAADPHAAPAAPPTATGGQDTVREAVVFEVVQSDQYTIVQADHCGARAWVAGPKIEVENGQTIEMVGGSAMTDFRAEGVDRTFDVLLMVPSLKVVDRAVACEGKAPTREAPTGGRVGTVLETMRAAGYTYAKLDVCGEQVWVAGTQGPPLAVGQVVGTEPGARMVGFESKTLNRTFEQIYFVPTVMPTKSKPVCN